MLTGNFGNIPLLPIQRVGVDAELIAEAEVIQQIFLLCVAHGLMAAIPRLNVPQELGKAAGGCGHEATLFCSPWRQDSGIKRTRVGAGFVIILGPPSWPFGSNSVCALPKGLFNFRLHLFLCLRSNLFQSLQIKPFRPSQSNFPPGNCLTTCAYPFGELLLS
jgi:hypothetical protein